MRENCTEIVDQSQRAATTTELDLISGQSGFLLSGAAVSSLTRDSRLPGSLRPVALGLRSIDLSRALDGKDAGLAHGKAGIGFSLARWAEIAEDNNIYNFGVSLISEELKFLRKSDSEMPINQ